MSKMLLQQGAGQSSRNTQGTPPLPEELQAANGCKGEGQTFSVIRPLDKVTKLLGLIPHL